MDDFDPDTVDLRPKGRTRFATKLGAATAVIVAFINGYYESKSIRAMTEQFAQESNKQNTAIILKMDERISELRDSVKYAQAKVDFLEKAILASLNETSARRRARHARQPEEAIEMIVGEEAPEEPDPIIPQRPASAKDLVRQYEDEGIDLLD